MRKLLRFSFVILIALSLFSCEKDDGNGGKTKTDLLTAHAWVFSDVTSDSDDAMVEFALALVKAIMEDAVYVFDANGSYSLTVYSETGTGTWEFSSDEKTLILDEGTEDEVQNQIVTLTDSQLVLSSTDVDEDIGTYTVTYTWVKQ